MSFGDRERGGLGPQNWVSCTGYPALNVVETGPTQMSGYVNQDHAQPTAHLRRYSLRLDGFASLRAGWRRNFAFEAKWRGRLYRSKQVEAVAVEEEGWLVITVLVRYF